MVTSKTIAYLFMSTNLAEVSKVCAPGFPAELPGHAKGAVPANQDRPFAIVQS
jgi:hypothetical protein